MAKLNKKLLTGKTGADGSNRRSVPVVFLELAGFLAALTGVGYFLTGTVGYSDASVHPYWSVVLFMAAHYGLGWGIIGSVSASVLHILTVPTDIYFARLPLTVIEDSGILVAAWILAAALVGAYRDGSERRVVAARHARASAQAERDQLARHSETLVRENAELRAILARSGRPATELPAEPARVLSAVTDDQN